MDSWFNTFKKANYLILTYLCLTTYTPECSGYAPGKLFYQFPDGDAKIDLEPS